MNNRFLILGFLIAAAKLGVAAPCCGGTANIPALISGDDKIQFSTTLVSSQVVAESPIGGGIKYRKPNDNENSQTLKLDAATLISDRWQMGISLPLTRRSRERGTNSANAMGLGDTSVNVAYEAIPDWDYSVWRPKTIIFLGATFPTGGSIYDARELYRLDSRGRGFYSFSLGSLLTKSWGIWDLALVLEAHQPLSRTISNEVGDLYLKPGFGTSGSFGIGVSPFNGNFRLGTTLSSSYESPISTEGVVTGTGEKVILWTPTAILSYMASDVVSMSLTYSDQTLIRGSENSALARSLSVLVQKRWER